MDNTVKEPVNNPVTVGAAQPDTHTHTHTATHLRLTTAGCGTVHGMRLP